MGLIREPLNVDFYVEPKLLTKEEREAISAYILNYQKKKQKPKGASKPLSKKRKAA